MRKIVLAGSRMYTRIRRWSAIQRGRGGHHVPLIRRRSRGSASPYDQGDSYHSALIGRNSLSAFTGVVN